jgi:hypothetical protein
VTSSDIETQFLANRRQQFTRRHQRIEDQRHLGRFGHLFQQATAYRGLAGTDLARQLHKTAGAALPHAVQKMRQRVTVRRAEVNERRVRRDRKRRFTQSKKLQVQFVLSLFIQFEQYGIASDRGGVHGQCALRCKAEHVMWTTSFRSGSGKPFTPEWLHTDHGPDHVPVNVARTRFAMYCWVWSIRL